MDISPNQHHQTEPPLTLLRVGRTLLPLIILGLAVHLILPEIATLGHSYQVIKGMIFWAFGLAVAAQIASYLGSGYLLKALVNLSGSSLSIIRGTMITLAGASFGMVAGGMVGSATAVFHWMEKEQVKPEAATLAGTIPGLFNNVVLVAVSLVGLVHLLVVRQLSQLQAVSFIVILVSLVGLIGLLVWGLWHRDKLVKVIDNVGRRWARFRHQEFAPQTTEKRLAGLFSATDTLLTGGWHGPLLGAALNVAFDMLTLYFLFIAAGHRVSLGVLLTGYGLPLLLGKIAFMVPGGVGVIEGTMTALYTGLGIDNAVTVVVVLGYRILSFWLPLLFGFPLILVLQRSKSKVSSE
jgi:uncharacterized protein (TIRG00374 family)